MIEGGTIHDLRTDHIGRPVFATDATGTKVWEATYLPFGGVHTSTGANSDLRFPGQWFQSESALHQNWMRDYDPTTGRYIQADPLGLVDGASVYGYVGANPQNHTDPTGLLFEDDGGEGGGGSLPICEPPDKCILVFATDEWGLKNRGWAFAPDKLCIYRCFAPDQFGKKEYGHGLGSFRFTPCAPLMFRFMLQPLEPRDRALIQYLLK